MKKIELKNCPNCNERIGIQDIECPYCKYIDDPKYAKYNANLKKKNNKNKKADKYRIILFVPVVSYLLYLLFRIKLTFILIPLILLSFMCLFVKKSWILSVIGIDFVVLLFNLIYNICNMVKDSSYDNLLIEILLFILGVIFIIIPKIIYLIKSKKKVRKRRNV